jgi:hypothetical protein
VTDSGAGADLLQVIVSFLISDTGSGTESEPGVGTAIGVGDNGSGNDAISLLSRILLDDTGSGNDSLAALVQLAVSDDGTGSDSLSVITRLAVLDSGIGAEIVSVLIGIAIADTGNAEDVISIIGNIGKGYHYGKIHCLKEALALGAWIKRKKYPYPKCNKND